MAQSLPTSCGLEEYQKNMLLIWWSGAELTYQLQIPTICHENGIMSNRASIEAHKFNRFSGFLRNRPQQVGGTRPPKQASDPPSGCKQAILPPGHKSGSVESNKMSESFGLKIRERREGRRKPIFLRLLCWSETLSHNGIIVYLLKAQ